MPQVEFGERKVTEFIVESIVDDPDLVTRRRAQIVGAATQLFSKQGFYRTTMKEVAKLAGMSAGLVYQYVREKDDVLLLVILDVLDAYAREIPSALVGIEEPLDRLIASVSAYCHVVDRYRAATVLAYRSTKSLSKEKRGIIQQRETETNDNIAREIKNCIKKGVLKTIDSDITTYQLVMIAHAWALKSWYFKSRVNIDGYIDQTIRNIFLGVLTTMGARRYETISKANVKVA